MMRMKLEDDRIIVAAVDNMQYQIIKSWNLMRWNRSAQWLEGAATLELLDRLASMVKLPGHIEAVRQGKRAVRDAVDTERLKEEPSDLYKYPVKVNLFKHQKRAANMALLTFGLIDPDTVPKEEKPDGNPAEEVMDAIGRWFDYVEGNDHAFDDQGGE